MRARPPPLVVCIMINIYKPRYSIARVGACLPPPAYSRSEAREMLIIAHCFIGAKCGLGVDINIPSQPRDPCPTRNTAAVIDILNVSMYRFTI
eukprot:SAG31_NODE_328_length_17643_cov_46.707649_7_plen_93_part_00